MDDSYADEFELEEEQADNPRFFERVRRNTDTFRASLRIMCKSPAWFWTVLSLVLLNTALRCSAQGSKPGHVSNRFEPQNSNPGSVHHGMPDWWANTLLKLEIVFLVIFSGKVIILLSVILNYLIIK